MGHGVMVGAALERVAEPYTLLQTNADVGFSRQLQALATCTTRYLFTRYNVCFCRCVLRAVCAVVSCSRVLFVYLRLYDLTTICENILFVRAPRTVTCDTGYGV